MPISVTPTTVTLLHPAGSSASVLLFGATLTSWISPARTALPSLATTTSVPTTTASERLFVSGLASLDGSKPVRGGVPICWPIFGPPGKEQYKLLKQHGFARSSLWTYDGEVLDDAAGVSARFTLSSSSPTLAAEAKAAFPYPFELIYTVTLAEHQLTASLRVRNTGAESFEFQALLHNYFRGPKDDAGVQPLKGVEFADKVKGGRGVEERDIVDVKEFTDRVYESASGTYTLSFPSASYHLEIRTTNFPDVTVWNPGPEAGRSMADMEEGGWDRFVCVEPGYVTEWVDLKGGEEWFAQEVLTVL